jgi:capsular polysaccharide biosynthesis protein
MSLLFIGILIGIVVGLVGSAGIAFLKGKIEKA